MAFGGLLCPSDRSGVDRRHRREVDGLIWLGLHGPSLVALRPQTAPRRQRVLAHDLLAYLMGRARPTSSHHIWAALLCGACRCSPARGPRIAACGPEFEPLPEPRSRIVASSDRCRLTAEYLLSCVNPLRPFRQHILDAVGLNICEDIVSTIDLPRFDNSAMDGYAVRAEDVAEASQERRSACRSSVRSLQAKRPRIGCLPEPR